jgi:hypothetical protein
MIHPLPLAPATVAWPFARGRAAAHLLLACLAGALAASCASAPPQTSTPRGLSSSASHAPSRESPQGLRTASIASAPEGTLGPYVAYGPQGAMALYSPGGESPRRWVVQPIGKDGAAAAAARNLADAPDAPAFAVLRADPAASRFIALWTGDATDGSALMAAVLRQDGSLVGTVAQVARGPQTILWADAVPAGGSFLIAWAAQDGSHATIMARKLDPSGSPLGNAAVLDDAALAWQIEPIPSGAAVAVTRAVPAVPALGKVALHILNGDGSQPVPAVPLSDSPTAQLDVDLARVQDSLIVAWTDRRQLDDRVWIAVTDLRGNVREAAHPALPAHGDQALVDIVSPADPAVRRALLVVDTLPHTRADAYGVSLFMVDPLGKTDGRATTLTMLPDSAGETYLTGAPGGFLVLARGADCPPNDPSRLVPWLLRIGADQQIRSASPLRWGGPLDVVASAWSPGCIAKQCFAIAADANVPATVVSVGLDDRVAPCPSPWTAHEQDAAAFVSNQAIAPVDAPLSGLDIASFGSSSMVAWVTHHVEGPGASKKKPPPGAPGDPSKPLAAEVAVLSLDEQGQPRGARKLVSVRGYSPGGVAIAADPQAGEACVAWAARDNGDPQVFLTKVAADGSKLAQRMLTRARGDASDVAIVRVPDGWVVGWVDGRDGNGEVYVARVDRALRSVGPEVRVSNAPGDAAEVSLLWSGEDVLVAYGDSRDRADRGLAMPYFRRLRLANLTPLGEERLIARTRLHTRSVRLSLVGQDVVASWLEVAAPGVAREAQDKSGVRVMRLDPGTGQALSPPMIFAPERGEATAYDVACEAHACRGVMSIDDGTTGRLATFSFDGRSPLGAVTFAAAFGGPPGADVCPSLDGGTLVYSDAGTAGEARIRRAVLAGTTR